MSSNGINPMENLGRVGSQVGASDATEAPKELARTQQPLNVVDQEAIREKIQHEETSKEDVKEVTSFLNESADLFNLSIRFQLDEEIDRVIVSVTDKETEEVIRQIPSEEIVQLAKRLNEMVGVLFNETA